MASVRPRSPRKSFQVHQKRQAEEMLEEEEQYIQDSREETDDEDIGEDGYSESSEESGGIVDAAVKEDMDKFQDSFNGIRQRFRLINRIGEGQKYSSGL